MSYLLLNYNNAPILTELEDYSIMSKNVNYLIKELIHYYRKDKLDKYIGDFIVKQYKKDDPELQAMWSSDTDRLNYFIRELINNKDVPSEIDQDMNKNKKINKASSKLQWIVDKKGVKMTKYIINPLLNYICDINTKYLLHQAKENECLDNEKSQKNLKDMQVVADINSDIKNNILSKNINKYIAPHFYFDKSNCSNE